MSEVTVQQVVVYVAGPYRAPHLRGVVENIQRAADVALKLWQAGIPALCPHKNTALYDGPEPADLWLEGDLVMLRRCDGLVLVEGWEKSSGTKAEIAEARRLGIPVFEDVDAAIQFFTDDGA